MTVRSYARVVALAGATAVLIAGALALWLGAAPPSDAASADQVQGTTVTVVDETISWGSAGDCVQSMSPADFGSVLPGAVPQSSTFNGCVTSNASGWGVSVSATDLSLAAGGFAIPKGNLAIGVNEPRTGTANGASSPCAAATSGCLLDTAKTLFTDAAAGTGGFGYFYALTVPLTATAGAYNGTVTFTASN
jgi:hypothetical protein